ncbi:Hsp70 family protein, partial [bacterium]|nr:Hsp70 family protein [bacterium]
MVVIGIDLGTTNSCVAIVVDKRPQIIPDNGGRTTIPSIVSFYKDAESSKIKLTCGHQAYQQMLINTENTVYNVKRLLGHTYKSPLVAQLLTTLSYTVQENKGKGSIDIIIPIANRSYSPEEVSSYILTEMKKLAENLLEEPVTGAVITVPAYFNNKQRQATKDAALIAGLDVLRIINEPTAAAIAYGYSQNIMDDKLLAIFDFGGGTFDVTLMEVSRGTFNVIATAGNTFLGGEDITNALFEQLLTRLHDDHDISDIDDPVVLQRLRDYAESSKKALTTQQTVSINIPYFKDLGDGNYIDFSTEITRKELNEIALPFVKKSIKTFKNTLEEVHIDAEDLDGVILIGGQTRMPLIQEELSKVSGDIQILRNINPDETVAMGAAIQATLLSREQNDNDNLEDMLLIDVTPHNLGVAIAGDLFYTLIQKNSSVPTSVDDFFLTSHDNQTEARILLLQGDATRASENEMLGEFLLKDLPPKPRGKVRIKITYEIDLNGIVTVEAVDVDTNR